MNSEQSIELSVVIASHNRRDLLRRCLESLAAQTQDPDTFEVIVADDGSIDGTAEMVEGLQLPFRLRLLRLQKAGKAVAVNTAIQVSSAPVCLFTDDDVIASPDLVAEHIVAHRAGDMTGIGRLVQEPPTARDWYAHAFAHGFNEHYEDLAHRPAAWTDCYGANLSAPRSVLIECGGFATDLPATDDLELGLRLSRAGCLPRYLPRAKGIHNDQKRVSQMLKDARLQGAAHVKVVQMYPATRSQLLNWVVASAPQELALRRLLIALGIKPSTLTPIGWLMPGSGRKMVLLHFVRRLAFWRSVRENVSRSHWRELTSKGAEGDGQDADLLQGFS